MVTGILETLTAGGYLTDLIVVNAFSEKRKYYHFAEKSTAEDLIMSGRSSGDERIVFGIRDWKGLCLNFAEKS